MPLDGPIALLGGIGSLETVARSLAAATPPELPGVGPPRRCRRRPLPVTQDEVTELRNVGAVGEICARFFDVAGQPCVTSLDRRMVALDLDQLRAIPLVVGVACGREKAAAILGAVRGGYVKSLVTDDVTATDVLALARSVAGGARDGEDGHTKSEREGAVRPRWQRSDCAHTRHQTAGDRRAPGQAPLAHG